MFSSNVQLRTIAALLAVVLATGGCASGGQSEKESKERAPLTESAEQSDSEPDEQSSVEESTEQTAEAEERDATASTTAKKPDEEMPVEAVGPVAVVDGEEIGAEAYNKLISRSVSKSVPHRIAIMQKQRVLEQVIDDHLISRELRESGIEVSDAEVEDEFAEFKKRFPDEASYKRFLERTAVEESQIKEDMRKSLQLKQYLRKSKGVSVSDREARDYYDENHERFEHDAEVRARHILVKLDREASEKEIAEAKARAMELYERAKAGEDFAKLAEDHSEGPSSTRGGDLGFFPKKRMVPPFANAAFELKKGEVSKPVKTQFGFHVIKAVDKKPARTEPFEEAKSTIVDTLEREKFRHATREMVKTLRGQADIVEKPENIEVRVTQDARRGTSDLTPEKRREIKERIKKKLQEQQGEE